MTFENTVSNILEKGHVKSMRTPRRVCMNDSDMTMDEAKEAFGASFSLTTPLGIELEASLV